jgi:DNA-binding MarR family transcriptional regulator
VTAQSFDTLNEPLRQRLRTGLAKIGMVLKSQAWQDAGMQGLTPTQGQILAILSAKKSEMRLSEVAHELGVTPATASDAVAVLSEKGLALKGRAADDARAIAITLTPTGQQEAGRVANWSDFMLSAIDELTPIEQEVFLQGLIKIIRKLQEDGYISVTRMCLTCAYFHPNQYLDGVHPHHCGFVDAPFGNRDLRIDCPDQLPAAQPPKDSENQD